jgi:hypothetical protein
VPNENFFILGLLTGEPTSKGMKTRLYFTQLSELQKSDFRLLDENTGEGIEIKLQVSFQFTIPQLDICIIFSDYRLARYADTLFGACLGVRYKDAKRVELYYICPVTCIISSPAARPTSSATKVAQEIIAESVEFALEYGSYLSSRAPKYIQSNTLIDFPQTIPLTETRSMDNGKELNNLIAILAFPISVCLMFYWACWFACVISVPNPSTTWFTILLVVPTARVMLFLFEDQAVKSSLAETEFEEWCNGLYGDTIVRYGASIYIHYRPSIVFGILLLGLIAWPIFLLLERLMPEREILRRVVLLTCELEAALVC